MAVSSAFDVIYEFGDKVLRRDTVLASAGDVATITTVLSNNGKATHPSGALKIFSIKASLQIVPGTILS